MDVSGIRRSLLDLSDEELLDVIKGKRSLRAAAPKPTPKKKAEAKPKSEKRSTNIAGQLKAMDPETKKQLLRELGIDL